MPGFESRLDLLQLFDHEDIDVEEGQVRSSGLQRLRPLHQALRHQQANQHEKRHNQVCVKRAQIKLNLNMSAL